MQKSWRASDILMVLMLVVIGITAGLLLVQWDRLHQKMVDVGDSVDSMSAGQRELQSRVDAMDIRLRDMERRGVSVGAGDSGDSGTGADGAVENDAGQGVELAADVEGRRGDWLIRQFGSDPASLNPITSTDAYASRVHLYMYDPLIDRDPDTLEWYGKMAESWEVSEDGLVITFKLRPGMTWSDGRPITSEDVLFSFQLLMNPEVEAMNSRIYFKDVEKVEAPDALTVRYTFRKPYFKSLEVVGAGYMTIVPKHFFEGKTPEQINKFRGGKSGEPLIASGRYVLERWNQDEVRLTRNNRYYGKAPNFDKIVFKIVRDENVVYQMIQAGQIDYVGLTPTQWMKAQSDELLKKNHELYLYQAPAGYQYIAWNNNKKLFQDVRVRRALTHLVPRELIRDRVFHGLVDVVSGPFWPGSDKIKIPLQYDTSIKPHPFDPHEALRLLAEAGWSDSNNDGVLDKDGEMFRFNLLLPSGSEDWISVGSIVKENFAKVGIQVEVRQLEWTMFIEQLNERSYDAVALAWTAGVEGDPIQIWHSDAIKEKGSNHVSYSNAEVDRLLEEAQTTLDPEARNKLYHRFHAILHEEQPYTFMFTGRSRAAVQKRFEGVVVHNLGLDDSDWWTSEANRKYGR